MSLIAPDDTWTWVHVPRTEALDVVLLGEPHTWESHWLVLGDRKRPQPVRCCTRSGRHCDFCHAGHERRIRYVLPVRLEGAPRLLEVGKLAFPTLAIIDQLHQPWPGNMLRVWRERPHMNAPVLLRHLGRAEVLIGEQRDIRDLVDRLGTAPDLLQEARQAIAKTR